MKLKPWNICYFLLKISHYQDSCNSFSVNLLITGGYRGTERLSGLVLWDWASRVVEPGADSGGGGPDGVQGSQRALHMGECNNKPILMDVTVM